MDKMQVSGVWLSGTRTDPPPDDQATRLPDTRNLLPSSFVIGASSLIRHSDFVIRVSAPMNHITPDFLVLGLGWYAVFLIAITCHEAAHAWAAKLLGDPTAYYAGQVTLNPGPHIEREPIGTIIVPVLSYVL